MSEQKVPGSTRTGLRQAIEQMQTKAMTPGIPAAQRLALKNRAQELRDQLIELEAARFNQGTARYRAAIARVDTAIANLKQTLNDLENAIKALDDATRLFKALDSLLNVAARFVGLP